MTVALAAALLLAFSLRSAPTSPAAVAVAPAAVTSDAEPTVLRFPEGSVATPLEAGTVLLVDSADASSIALDLRGGAARFEVTPGLPRSFRVRAGVVTVHVVGTIFTVRRVGDGATVAVEHGRVRVEWDPSGSASVAAGESGTFPTETNLEAPRGGASAHAPPSEPVGPIATPMREPTPSTSESRRDARPRAARSAVAAQPPAEEAPAAEPSPTPQAAWRALADQGDYRAGYGLLLADIHVLRSEDVEELMQAADVARLSGHAAQSVPYLRRALHVGSADPRAPLAAFTLGRVLLQELGEPVAAADAFARCRQLAPNGSLASDALAREAEAHDRAQRPDAARARAAEYLRLYPNGLRADALRTLLGSEEE